MTVNRYELELYHNNGGEMLACPHGGYVDFEDYAELHRQLTAYEATVTNLTAQVQGLAAENALTNQRMSQLIKIINNADNSYCMCGDEMKNHSHGGCGHPTGMFDYHYNQWLASSKENPNTDAALAEMRAQGVDLAIERLNKKFEGTGGVGVPVMALKHLASELRKEQGK